MAIRRITGVSESLLPRKFHSGLVSLFLVLLVQLLSSCSGLPAELDSTGDTDPLGVIPPPNFTRGLIVVDAPTPGYPLYARTLGIEGWVSLRFSVDRSGQVIRSTIEAIEEEPPGYFLTSAMNAVRRMQFENSRNEVVDDVRYVFRYELEEPAAVIRDDRPRLRELIPIRYVTPRYPPGAESNGLEGFAVVSFTVNEEGAVEDLAIVDSQPPGVFDQEALLAAERLRFEPRLINEVPVRVEGVTYRFDWRLPR